MKACAILRDKSQNWKEAIVITSGYRTLKTNNTLSREGAAKNSMHLYGKAGQKGTDKPNRTGTGATGNVGNLLKGDLREGYPAPTTKKLAFKAVRGELLGFLRGYDNAAQFRELGCNIWDQNANENATWLASPYRKGHDDLGRIYGVQWTRWRDTRVARATAEAARLHAAGYRLLAHDTAQGVYTLEREINQLEECLRTLLTNPYDRRVRVTAWRPDEFDQMALPPCHVDYQFVALPDNTLHVTMGMRSVDVFPGLPFNMASTAMLLHIMARLCGREAATMSIFLGDTHIYKNHVEAVNLQMSREPLNSSARLVLSEDIKPIVDLADIRGAFERIEPEHIWLEGYESMGAIKAPMAV